jgi:hypothetical protein
MPWCCPACRTLIRPQLTAAGEDVPRPDKIYTCVVCRLPLVLAEDGSAMVVAPLQPDEPLSDSGR